MLRSGFLVRLVFTSLKSILLFGNYAADSLEPLKPLMPLTPLTPNFLFSWCNILVECCLFTKKFLNLHCRMAENQPDGRHIESVFAVLNRKSDSFQRQQDKRTALISCIVMWRCILFAPTHTIQVWGYCIVYLLSGFVRASI